VDPGACHCESERESLVHPGKTISLFSLLRHFFLSSKHQFTLIRRRPSGTAARNRLYPCYQKRTF
jgi:hypothetical protein